MVQNPHHHGLTRQERVAAQAVVDKLMSLDDANYQFVARLLDSLDDANYQFLLRFICSLDDANYQFLLRFICDMHQHPETLGKTAVWLPANQ